MTTQISARDTLWLIVLGVVAVAGSFLFACMTPFVAIAVAAALTLPLEAAVVTVLGAWVANQIVGYGFQHYPTDTMTILRGVGIAVAALAALGVGRLGRAADGGIVATRAVVALIAAFVAYEVVTYAFAMVLGGTMNFTPSIVWMIGSNEVVWFTGAMLLNLSLRGAAPALFGRMPAVRIA